MAFTCADTRVKLLKLYSSINARDDTGLWVIEMIE